MPHTEHCDIENFLIHENNKKKKMHLNWKMFREEKQRWSKLSCCSYKWCRSKPCSLQHEKEVIHGDAELYKILFNISRIFKNQLFALPSSSVTKDHETKSVGKRPFTPFQKFKEENSQKVILIWYFSRMHGHSYSLLEHKDFYRISCDQSSSRLFPMYLIQWQYEMNKFL